MINISRYTCARTHEGEAGTPLMAAYADGHRQGQDVPQESLAYAHAHARYWFFRCSAIKPKPFILRKVSPFILRKVVPFILRKVSPFILRKFLCRKSAKM